MPGTTEIWAITVACRFLPLTLVLGHADKLRQQLFDPECST
jgi:hypothetical protein